LQQPGEVVTCEELRSQNWPADTFVDFDNSLNTAIKKLREALADSADNPRFIETQPRRGYRFIAPVAPAHLQLGRAYAMQGDTAKSRAAYQDFLTLWKDADPDIPVFKEAKAEYKKLR